MASIHAAPYDEATADAQGLGCARCGRPPPVCVCDRLVALRTRLRVLILQHPREQDRLLGSAGLAASCLPSAKLVVGLSWPSLRSLLPEESHPGNWAVLYPDRRALGQQAPALSLRGARGGAVDRRRLRGLIVLDGSWSQAKALWWRNAWLLKCARLTLQGGEPSIYGRLRRQPQRHCVSTLEAIADACEGLGEAPAVRLGLRQVFRTLLQRVRDQPAASAASPQRVFLPGSPLPSP